MAMRDEQGSLVYLHTVMFSRSIASFLRCAYIQVHNCAVVQSMQTHYVLSCYFEEL